MSGGDCAALIVLWILLQIVAEGPCLPDRRLLEEPWTRDATSCTSCILDASMHCVIQTKNQS